MYWHTSLVPRLCPAFHHLQYGNALVHAQKSLGTRLLAYTRGNQILNGNSKGLGREHGHFDCVLLKDVSSMLQANLAECRQTT